MGHQQVKMVTWNEHVAKWKDCQACPLCQQRFRICLARGTVPCQVCFIGETPGASEDACGLPFYGPAGNLLDKIIERALPPEVTYTLTNLVCCFPREAKDRGDNEPEHNEILACRSRLIEFVNIAQPRLIVCVGALAEQYVDHSDTVLCVDIVHPAAILRMPLAQKQMATQKTVVVLRRTVEDMLQSDRAFTKWGEKYASSKPQTPRERLRTDYDRWAGFADPDLTIPF